MPRIVITGAPASGKSGFLERLSREPLLAGFVFLSEAARELLVAQPGIRQDWAEFHRRIYGLQAAREGAIKDRPMITDRGTADAFAFHPDTLADIGTSLEREYERYSAVIQLGSAASLDEIPWKTDDVRQETREEAIAIEQALTRVWQHHRGYHFVPAVADVEEKYSRVLDIVRACVTGGGLAGVGE